jgi:hypothetical protein
MNIFSMAKYPAENGGASDLLAPAGGDSKCLQD